jgi:hypothetical protein
MKAVVLLALFAVALVAAKQDALDANEQAYNMAGKKCKKPTDCGGGLRCNLLTSKCERVCTKAGDACKTGADCCSSTCRDGVCLCFDKGATCTWGDECCDGSCSSTKGCCRKSGTDCETHNQCCSGICQAPVASPSLLEEEAAPAKKADEKCDTDDKSKKPAAAAAGKKAADKKPAAKKDDAKKDTPAPAPKKMKPASNQCCSDFGQKCSDSEPCCPPNICSDLLGMCTLAVKID